MATTQPADGRSAALLERAAARQREAAQISADLDVESGWARFGAVHLVGAAAYGLIVAPDIDYEIFGPLTAQAGFEQCTRWAANPHVTKIKYVDGAATEDHGLGWQVTYRNGDTRWSVQMWLLPADYPGPRAADLVAPLNARLDLRARTAVLSIKEAMVQAGTTYRSIDLYRAVLDDGIDTPERYKTWCAENTTSGLLGWRPKPPGGAR